jgi:succinate dehydrogenase/fumarate reductase flavoprotein subunit
MAGLAAAARARELGAEPLLLEKGDRAGGSMLLSSGVIWRHATWEGFRADCPDGDPELQLAVWEGLDEAIEWLEALGAPVTARGTGNPLTSGTRFDPAGLRDALVEAAGDVRLGEPLAELREGGPPVVLATGGFQGDRGLVREHVTPHADELLLRANPWSAGDGLRLGLAAGARLSEGLEQFYGRNMPAPPARVDPGGYVELAQLYARHATVRNADGQVYAARTWSEIDVVQWTARQPGARAWYEVAGEALEAKVRERTVGDMVDAAERAGAPVERRGDSVTVEVLAGITTTLGGLRVDSRCRAAPGLYAAGADAGGFATGGYASGLAAALVLGRTAAESALAEAA